ncbi:twin-arginine translocase TatA/TatE family subunit [Mycolicibacterium moriokaense]|nr:twin-arginine translocase TatA/TatE family subunit [Mycolicibacterium moriokaense]
MGGLQPWHWVIVIAVFVLLFGAKKLPDAARSLGQSMRIFKSEVKEMKDSKPEAEKPATPIASERVDAPEVRADVAGQAPQSNVAGQAAPASEPSDKRTA